MPVWSPAQDLTPNHAVQVMRACSKSQLEMVERDLENYTQAWDFDNTSTASSNQSKYPDN